MNLPNKLTTSRFVITIFFVAVMLWDSLPYYTTFALVLFVAGGITDILDGHLARKHGLKTDFGVLMDPLADKILVCSGFILLVGISITEQQQAVILGEYYLPEAVAVPGMPGNPLMPAWMVIVIV